MKSAPTFVILLALSALSAASCGSDESTEGTPRTGSGGDSGISKLPAGWNTIKPGGATTCARDTEFQYFVRPGTVNRVLVEFRGGGACWNAFTCSISDSLFQETADVPAFVQNEAQSRGIYDHADPKNPFKDWHHVFIPYCTGDVHWGDATRTYDNGMGPFTIQHKGGVNARAVLDWLYENVPAPEKVFVTGCSAGAYGAIMWSSHIRNHYKNSKVYQLADSGAGVITDSFFQESFPQWNAEASYPLFIPNVDPNAFTRLPQLYTLIGATFPDMFLSQYNTQFDENQHFYYNAMGGGDANEWSQKMRANVSEIEASTPNFSSYVAPGFVHCIIPSPEFFSVESAGVKLVDWINDVVNDKPVESVSCEPNCGAPKPAP